MSNQRPRYNWNDIVYFLEVARQKSLVRAAEKLRVDHTTVSRRVRELERSLNTSLFSRGKSGFNLTETGQRLLAISDGLGGKPLHCAFYGGEFLMAIPRDGNLFEIGRLTRSLDHAEADIRRLAGEFTIPARVSRGPDRQPARGESGGVGGGVRIGAGTRKQVSFGASN